VVKASELIIGVLCRPICDIYDALTVMYIQLVNF
jgi:hypothetical protein